MAAVQQQGQNREERRDWLAFLKSRWFAESTWISALTKWVLTLGGQAARLTLIICTLYMSAELYPGISLPAPLNVAVFIILSFALDMGGLGLAQIAKTARTRGMEDEAKRGEKLARFLIIIMISGLVAVSLENMMSTWTFVDTGTMDFIKGFWTFVGVVLSVLRVICAVQYGHVLHALEKGMEQVEQRDEDERVSMRDQIANLQQRLAQQQQNATTAQANLQKELSSVQTNFQRELSSVKARNESLQNELSQANISLLSSQRNESSLKVFQGDLELSWKSKMEAAVDAAKAQVKAEMQLSQVALQEEIATLRRLNADLKARDRGYKETGNKPARSANPVKFDAREFVFSCLAENPDLKLSDIVERARKIGQELSEPTTSRYRKDWRNEHGESKNGSSSESSAM